MLTRYNIRESKYRTIPRAYKTTNYNLSGILFKFRLHTTSTNSYSDTQDISKKNRPKKANLSTYKYQSHYPKHFPDFNSIGFKCVKKGTISNKNVPPYEPLAKYSDPTEKVPKLHPLLEHVLYSPGAHFSMDPRTRHKNYPSFLRNIPSINDFKFDKVIGFVPPNKDKRLMTIAKEINDNNTARHKKIKYYSSTSSMTGVLKHFHYLLSGDRPAYTDWFSRSIPNTNSSLTGSIKNPEFTVVELQDKENKIYSVDSDKSASFEIVLSLLGHLLELQFTSTKKEFSKFLKSSNIEPDIAESAYHYAKLGNFLMRSQLDAYSPDLPGTGVFDLKTRAVCAVRYDLAHSDFHPTDYLITKQFGLYESFERELFDLARSTMLKYTFQTRIGNMDGIFLAYHNIRKTFGFQYIPQSFMDHIFHGYEPTEVSSNYRNEIRPSTDIGHDPSKIPHEVLDDYLDEIANFKLSHYQDSREVLSTYMAEFEFQTSVKLWQDVMDLIVEKTKGNPFRMITSFRQNYSFSKESEDTSRNFVEVLVTLLDDNSTSDLKKLGKEISDQDKEIIETKQEIDRFGEGDEAGEDTIPVVEKKHDNRPSMSETKKGNDDQSELLTEKFKKAWGHRQSKLNEFKGLNKAILEKSVNSRDKSFMFLISTDHYFNGSLSLDKHPTPPLDAIGDNKFKWEIDYQITEVTDEQLFKSRFMKHVSDVVRSTQGYTVSDHIVEDNKHYHDKNATRKQRVFRAYGARGASREDIALNKNNLEVTSK
ncbi:unnamed protein product [[Candida] boidinii]|uniref:Unnamed protein product n=1 Tax=Candida boidinii TaxID=5477 RepID=A0A9W6W9R4_CANBO|nr:hypothetical protein B5S30_g1817 [[Candida] boidinii]GME70196.1 unnamed protein product [[Candida] boidinii]GMG01159.1 unnamed protein product [[Candida] boidinii]